MGKYCVTGLCSLNNYRLANGTLATSAGVNGQANIVGAGAGVLVSGIGNRRISRIAKAPAILHAAGRTTGGACVSKHC